MYIIRYNYGDYSDYQKIDIFVTLDKKKAEAYINKHNDMLNKWKSYYSQYESIQHGMIWIKKEYSDLYFERWYSLKNTSEAFIEEIEFR